MVTLYARPLYNWLVAEALRMLGPPGVAGLRVRSSFSPFLLSAAFLGITGPCAAQQFTLEMRSEVYTRTMTLHAAGVRCREVHPPIGVPFRVAVEMAEDVHAVEIAAGKELVRQKLAANGLTLNHLLARVIFASAEILRMQPEAAVHQCGKLLGEAQSLAASTRQDLLQRSFEGWLMEIERRQQMSCASLDERMRVMAPRFLASIERRGEKPFDEVDLLLLQDAKKLENDALACQDAHSRAAAEQITMPGDFSALVATATAMTEAAAPLLRNVQAGAAVRRAIELLNSYLARPIH